MANFLVLFDIDGTLLFKQNVHADAFLYAFRTVYGVPDPVWRPHHGETDLLIIDIELGQLGFTQEEIDARLPECLDTMVKYMREHVHEDQGYMIDYVPEFLAAVRELGYFQGLVTGNLEDIAYVKMEHYGLVEFFEDHIGGFGNEHRDRAELIKIAINKAQNLGFEYTDRNVVYIADTPLDVQAARGAGVASVITTTGIYKRDDFEDCSPDLILDDLSHQVEFFSFLDELQENEGHFDSECG